jgi:hypothetical protein
MKFQQTILLGCMALAGVCQAQEATTQRTGVDSAIEDLKREIAVRDQVIRNLIQRIERLESAVGTNAPEVARGQPTMPQTRTQEVEAEQQQDAERLRAAFERTLIDRGGLVLPKWTWEIDTGLNYGHSSSEALTIDGFTVYPVLIVGDIVSERVRRDTFGTSVGVRVGLPWQTQVDVRVPYTYENSSRVSAAGEERTLSDHGLGDVELGISRPLWHSRGGTFDLLGALRWKTTTGQDPFGLAEDRVPFGTGFHALSASITAVTAQDPMVFFGTLTYTNDLPTRKGGRSINPGDSFGLQLGTALAVNLDTSLSFGFQQQFTNRTRVDGAAIPGSYVNTSSFSINLSHAFASGRAIDTGLVIGLSEDSPDLQLNVSVPFRPAR